MQQIIDYCTANTSEEPQYLAELFRYTYAKVLQPRMISGHFQGRLLSMVSKMASPKNILEIGTFTGYSALCLAEGLQTDGRIYTIEVNEENAAIAEKFIEKSPFFNQISIIVGDAQDILPTFDVKFDLVFVDADKKNYNVYFDLVANLLNPGGLVLFDNVLWDGKVTQNEATDTRTNELRTLNERITLDKRFENILLPIRDGLMMARLK